MDGLKLIVRHCDSHEIRQLNLLVMEKVLQVSHQGRDLMVMRGNEYGILDCGTSYPVLALPILAGQLPFPPYPSHEYLMSFLQKPGRNGDLGESSDGIVHRFNIVLTSCQSSLFSESTFCFFIITSPS